METLILILIWLGAINMVANIVFYIIFAFRMKDVISVVGSCRDYSWSISKIIDNVKYNRH